MLCECGRAEVERDGLCDWCWQMRQKELARKRAGWALKYGQRTDPADQAEAVEYFAIRRAYKRRLRRSAELCSGCARHYADAGTGLCSLCLEAHDRAAWLAQQGRPKAA